jgi:hypothetical protein
MNMQEMESMHNQFFNKDMLAKSLATGVVVSTVTQTGRGLVGRVIKSPLAMLTVGIALGFFAHKYRKKIIVMTSNATEQSKDYLLRQKANLKEVFLESDEKPENDEQPS